MNSKLLSIELDELVNAQCEGALTDQQAARIEELLAGDAELRRDYILYMHVHALAERGRGAVTEEIGSQASAADANGELAASASPLAPVALPPSAFDEPAPQGFLGGAYHGTLSYCSSGWPLAYMIATLIFGVGLSVGALVYVSQPEQVASRSVLPSTFGRGAGGEGSENVTHSRPTVGCITGMVDCRWMENLKSEIRNPKQIGNQKSEIRNQKSLVSLGDKFALSSGLMEITYDTGAKVILQGPVTYEVESAAGGFLSVGKLTARLEKKVASGQWSVADNNETSNPQSPIPDPSLSAIHHPLFTIKTPTAVVTDLGTEFGVEVDRQHGTTSHVFRGSVRLQVMAADGREEGDAQVLHENQSARVENRGSQGGGNRVVMLGPSAKPANFVRQIAKHTVKVFDLVDVVAGGDGFSGRRNRGIDPSNGRAVDTVPKKLDIVGDGRYHHVDAMPFVDGVFIPDGRAGEVQTDSAGHRYDGFPNTSNSTSDYLWALGVSSDGATCAWNTPTDLDGIDYSAAGHGALFLHANKGVTFDLEAIRRAYSDYKLLRFRAAAGNTETASERGRPVSADLWVLVDGQIRFRRRGINRSHGAYSVVVPLNANDRFLTLAATDGGDTINTDWIVFGDARLELLFTKTGNEPNLQPK